MTEEVNDLLEFTEMSMESAIEHLEKELVSVRAGRASISMLKNIYVDYYGINTPLQQVSNVSVVDARTLTIQPWEKAMLPVIEKSLFAANLGITPQNNGEMIRLNIPPLTEERRRSLAKQIKSIGEDAKVSIRQSRKQANTDVKKLVKGGISEDIGKDVEEKIQSLTNKYSKKTDALIGAKEKELMSI